MPLSEGDQDAKFSSFKVVLDGKMLLTPKNSDSETRTSPVTCQAREFYAYAKEYQDPSPIKISLPSFIWVEDWRTNPNNKATNLPIVEEETQIGKPA